MTTLTLPGLDRRVLDINEMRPILERLIASNWPEATLDSVHMPRVIPKRTGEVVIQYELRYADSAESGSGPRILYAQHIPEGVRVEEHNSGGFEWIEDLRLRVWLFPADPLLDHLGLLCNPQQFHKVFDRPLENVGYSSMSMGTPAEVLGYRLGRRCVVRVRWQDRAEGIPPHFHKNDIVIKMGRRRQALALWTRWRQLEHEGFCHNSSDGIGMPKSLFLHSDTGAIFQNFVHEPSLHDVLGTADFAYHCESAAQTLYKLHRTRIPGLSVYTAMDEISHLRWLTAMTGQTFPIVGSHLERKLIELERALPDPDSRACGTAHRDFYDKQVLSGESHTFLLDCDTLALADPALDYGNFIAHLLWRQSQHPEFAASIAEGIERFGGTYHDTGHDFRARSHWWLRASLLRLACIYTWRPRWHSQGVQLAQDDQDSLRTMFN